MSYFAILRRGLLLAWLPAAGALAQTGSVGIGTTTPNAAAALDITATGKGLLIPRLDSATRTTISTPPAGLLVYQTGPARAGFYYYTGTAWVFIPDKVRAGDNLGNHTATQNLNLQANALVGTGDDIGRTIGVGVTANGGLNLGQGNGSIALGYLAGGPSNGLASLNALFIGYQSGYQRGGNGQNNQFIGFLSGYSTNGMENSFSGNQSGRAANGNYNVYTGNQAGFANTGSYNTHSGYQSGYNGGGSGSTYTGYQSGYNGNGFFGTYTGYQSGFGTAAPYNVFIGYQSGYSNGRGHSNSFLGSRSGYTNTSGSSNVLLGDSVGYSNTTGSGNVFSGYQSGYYNTTGGNNTALGYKSGPASGSGALTNATALGANVSLTQSNTVVLGNGASVGVGTATPTQKLEVIGGIRAASSGAFSGTTNLDQGAHLQWNRSGGEGETWLINHLGLGASNAGIRFGGITTASSTAPTEWARFLNNGNFGLGTTSPSALLDVNGAVRLRGLSAAGVVTTDASGNLSSSPATAAFGGSFVQNTTSLQAGSNFNISGAGVVGSSLGIGTASPSGRLTVQTAADADLGLRLTDGSASNLVLQGLNGGNSGYQYLGFNGYYAGSEQRFNSGKNRWRVGTDQRGSADLFFVDTYDGTNVTSVLAANKSGQVGVGTTDPNATLDVNGGLRVRNLATAGVVLADANGRLSSAAPASLGTSFIQNQSSAQQVASFSISGSGQLGGSLTAQTLVATQALSAPQATINGPALVGQLGVGTATPSAALDVNGNARVSGGVTAQGLSAQSASITGLVYVGGSLNVGPVPANSSATLAVTGTANVSGTLQVGTSTTVGQVLTPTTGSHNMLAVAYGQVQYGSGGTYSLSSSSGNFTMTRNGTGVYTFAFPASSGLNSTSFDSVPVVITLFRSTGFTSYEGTSGNVASSTPGYITVRTYASNGAPADMQFSFVAFAP